MRVCACAPQVLRGMLHEYTACRGSFAHATPERWLAAALSNSTAPGCSPPAHAQLGGAMSMDSARDSTALDGRPRWRQLIMPFVLVRGSAHEPDAWLTCAQNYILPYGVPNASANPCEGDASERALHRMHAALLACVRQVYPGERIDGGFHKQHVVGSLRG